MAYLGSQFFDLLLFFIFIAGFFYFPGRFFFNLLKITVRSLDGLFIYTTTGLILFTLCAYALSWINLFILSVPILLITAFLEIRKKQIVKPLFLKKEAPYVFSVLFLSLVFSLTMLARGVYDKTRKKPSIFFWILTAMTLTSILIPLFFIQTGKVFEIIQVAWYYPILCSLFAGYGFALFFESKFNETLKAVLIALVVIFTLPSAYEHFSSGLIPEMKNRTDLSSPYFQTMNFLSKNGSYNDTVLKLPPEEKYSIEFLRGWYKTSAPDIPALGNKRTYLSNEGIEYYNLDTESRLQFVKKIIEFDINGSPLPLEIKNNLTERGIILIFSSYPLHNLVNKSLIKEIYANQNYRIYKMT